MSILIDKFIEQNAHNRTHVEIDGRWYIAKGLHLRGMYPDIHGLYNRLIDAIRVLRGKSFAIHYKEDE